MSSFPSDLPIFLCPLGLMIIFHLSCFGNSQFEFLLPFHISFLSFLILRHFVFLISLPNKVLLIFIPNSLRRTLFDWIFILNGSINICVFNSRQIIKFSSYTWIFLRRYVLSHILEISHRFLLLFFHHSFNLNLNTFNHIDRQSLVIFLFSILLKFINLFLIQKLFPCRCISTSQILSFLLLLCFCILLFPYFLNRCQKSIVFCFYIH